MKKPRLSDAEVNRIFDIAYQHAREKFGYFARPKLKIGVVPWRLRTHFYFDNYTVHVHRETRDDMYRSLLHELTHAYFEYCGLKHVGVFTEYCRRVGGCYAA